MSPHSDASATWCKKEFIQTLRDPRMRWLLFGPPIIQMLVFGYAATLDVKNVALAVLDLDNTQESRELVAHFSASRYFHLNEYAARRADLREGLDRGDILAAMEIDSGFAQRLRNGQGATVQVLVDCSNSNTALVALGYLNQIGAQFSRDYQLDRMQRTAPQLVSSLPQVDLEVRPWFNEGLESQWYFVPGVIGNVMLILVMMLTAFAVVREREIGTLEQVMVTPIRRWEFILGKTIPFFLVGCFDATTHRPGGNLLVRGALPRKPGGAGGRAGGLHPRGSGFGAVSFHGLREPAASDDRFLLLHHADDHALRLRHSHRQHAAPASEDELSQPAAPRHGASAQCLLERGWFRRALAGDRRPGGIAILLLTISVLRFHKSLE